MKMVKSYNEKMLQIKFGKTYRPETGFTKKKYYEKMLQKRFGKTYGPETGFTKKRYVA
jgi:Zn-finger domain-containing protein